MATLKAIRDTYDRDSHFKERILQLVSPISVSIYKLENVYIETFNLDTSPLSHCTSTQKGIVLSTIPGVQVRSVVDEHPILGIHLHNIMEWNEFYKLINNIKVDFDKSEQANSKKNH